MESYKKAIRAMLALPPSDPRNWYRVTLIHTFDCPHGNWWIHPWHRGYIGWVERICREMSGDPEFAFPYWDWTATPQLPDFMFDDILNPARPPFIAGAGEFKRRFAKTVEGLDVWKPEYKANGDFEKESRYGQLVARAIRTPEDLWFDISQTPDQKFFYDSAHARAVTREKPGFDELTRRMISLPSLLGALAPANFIEFASPKTLQHSVKAGFAPLEAGPHNLIHAGVGGMFAQNGQGVGPGGFMQANMSAVDPVFFLHHSNMDRLWDLWTRKQLARGAPILPDGYKTPQEQARPPNDYQLWAKEKFLFFVDEKGHPVSKTSAGDYASIGEFDYDYQPGSGEEIVTAAYAPRPVPARRFAGRLEGGKVNALAGASCDVAIPAGVVDACARGRSMPMTAMIEVEFGPHAHHRQLQVYVNATDPAFDFTPESPHFAGALVTLCAHELTGPVTFALPLGGTLNALSRANRLDVDATLNIRVVPANASPGLLAAAGAGAYCGDPVSIAEVRSVVVQA